MATAEGFAMDCLVCSKALPPDGKCLTCVECEYSYHLGPCAGVAENTFKTMGPAKRDTWRCKTCRHKDSRLGHGYSQEDSQGAVGGSTTLDEVNRKLDMLLSIKSSVDTLLPLPAKVEELMALKPVMEDLRVQVGELRASVEFCSAQYDAVLESIKSNDEKTGRLEGELVAVKSIVAEQSHTIQQLQNDLSDMQMLANRTTMEIHGMPDSQNENLGLLLNHIATSLGLPPLQQSDVTELCRLPSRKGATAPILVRFASSCVRDRWMNHRNRLREFPPTDVLSGVFFNEHLSRVCRELFWKARVKGKTLHYKFVWVKSGKIYAKKAENMDIVRINSVQDLEKLC